MSETVPVKYFRACSGGRVSLVGEFLAAGLSAQARDRNGLTGLMLAGRKGHVEVAKVLVKHGAVIDDVDHRARTALYHAVTFRRYEFVEYLASLGANVSPVDEYGWTPLDFAKVSDHERMVALLITLGAVHGLGARLNSSGPRKERVPAGVSFTKALWSDNAVRQLNDEVHDHWFDLESVRSDASTESIQIDLANARSAPNTKRLTIRRVRSWIARDQACIGRYDIAAIHVELTKATIEIRSGFPLEITISMMAEWSIVVEEIPAATVPPGRG